ncbi:MAG: ATP synthase subunit I [Clostridia bacterium]|nr:ATP synthase subunit I [Clostridia bacterium]MBR2973379.1 ATP synthase subunit I [Clostridia bacterium]
MLDTSLKREVVRMCIGVSVMSIIMIAGFAVFGHFNMSVLYGAALGTAVTLLNYFFLALSVAHVVNKKDKSDAKLFMNISYFLRIILIAVTVGVAIRFPFFNAVSVILPFIFERIVILIIHMRDGKNEHTGS